MSFQKCQILIILGDGGTEGITIEIHIMQGENYPAKIYINLHN